MIKVVKYKNKLYLYEKARIFLWNIYLGYHDTLVGKIVMFDKKYNFKPKHSVSYYLDDIKEIKKILENVNKSIKHKVKK